MGKSVTRRGHKSGQKNSTSSAIVNRRASFDYSLSNSLTVGLVLTGAETKAARMGRISLKGSYVVPKINQVTNKSELFLINSSFSLASNAPKVFGQSPTTVDTSPRKILAHRNEIEKLVKAKTDGLTIIPTKLLPSGRHVKLIISLGKGKKLYDKREVIKRRDNNREINKNVKLYR